MLREREKRQPNPAEHDRLAGLLFPEAGTLKYFRQFSALNSAKEILLTKAAHVTHST